MLNSRRLTNRPSNNVTISNITQKKYAPHVSVRREIRNHHASSKLNQLPNRIAPAAVHVPRPLIFTKSLIKVNKSNVIKVELPNPFAYNGSIAPFGNNYIFLYRSEEFEAGACLLNKKFQVVQHTPITLKLEQCVDPRPFWLPDKKTLLCFYSSPIGGFHKEHIRVSKIMDLSKSHEFIQSPNFRVSPEDLNGRQKNWIPFNVGNKSYIINSICPHQVSEFTWNNEKGITLNPTDFIEYKHSWPIPNHDLRGNTSPIQIDENTFMSTFHTAITHDVKSYYDNGIYLFESKPPFKVTKIAFQPYLRAEDAHTKPHRNPNVLVCFPTGMIQEGQDILISYGDNDSSCCILKTSVKELLSTVNYE